jgi:hypothetical protein
VKNCRRRVAEPITEDRRRPIANPVNHVVDILMRANRCDLQQSVRFSRSAASRPIWKLEDVVRRIEELNSLEIAGDLAAFRCLE